MTDLAVANPPLDVHIKELADRHGLSVAGAHPTLVTYVKQVWGYRDFIMAFASARLIAQFSTAKLGRIWQVLTPLTNALVYFLIFGVVLSTAKEVPNFIPFLCTGIFLFTFTQTVIVNGTQSITGNLGLIRAIHFPRASLPVATTLMQFQNLIASLVVLAGIVVATGEPLRLRWLYAVPALILLAVFNLGLALVMARLGSKLHDLKQIVPFVTRTWMYASAVMFSAAKLAHQPHPISDILLANPMFVYIELVREAIIASSQPVMSTERMWLYAIAWAAVFLVGGFIYFWRGEQEYGRG